LACVVVIEEEDDLLEVEEPLQVSLNSLLGGLGPQGDRDHRPVGSALPDSQGIQLTLGDYERLATSEEVLTEEGPRKITRDWVGLVLVLRLVGYKPACFIVIGEDNPLVEGVEADAELAAGLCREPTGTESSDPPWKIDCRSLWRSSTDLSVRARVPVTGEAVLVSVGVEGVGIRRSTGRAGDVSNELGVLIVVVYRSHSDEAQAVEDLEANPFVVGILRNGFDSSAWILEDSLQPGGFVGRQGEFGCGIGDVSGGCHQRSHSGGIVL
jgi:hypothetical protein